MSEVVGFEKILCPDEYYRIKAVGFPYVINFIESVDNTIYWVGPIKSFDFESGKLIKSEFTAGYGVMSEKEIEGYVSWLNEKFRQGTFPNYKPKN